MPYVLENPHHLHVRLQLILVHQEAKSIPEFEKGGENRQEIAQVSAFDAYRPQRATKVFGSGSIIRGGEI